MIDPSLFGNVQTVSVVSNSTSTTILAPAIAPPATAPPTITTATSDDGLSKGILIGIVIVATIGLIGAIVVGQYRQSNRNKIKIKMVITFIPCQKYGSQV